MVGWILKKILGSKNQRELKRLMPIVHRTNEFDEQFKSLSDEALRAKTAIWKEELAQIPELEDQWNRLDEILPEAFAVVKNAARRLKDRQDTFTVCDQPMKWDMVHFDVQLLGGIVLHRGRIAEMATGEGKTLVATLPLYLNALTGRGVHLVTVNDYLARRDAEWMGRLYDFLGLTVGCIQHDQEPDLRREQYAMDITYGTNSEFGFDYLRDNGMATTREQQVQRGYYYAIVDEVDSILIDEARTPLIISGPVGAESDEKYALFNAQVVQLVRRQTAVANDLLAKGEPLLEKPETQYEGATLLYKAQLGMPKNKKLLKLLNEQGVKQNVQRVELDRLADRKLPAREQKMRDIEDDLFFVMDERGRAVHLTDNEKIERRRAVEAEYAIKSETLHIIHKLLQAHALYEKDVEYVVQDGQVFIVDEFTGRLMPGRRWSDGLHQAVEAKEGVTVREETQTFATITIQNYFRMYDKLSGMTGTAETEEREFFEIYRLEVVVIPTNRPVRRIDKHDLIYKTRREKYNAVMDEIERQHKRGLPVLVGTVSV